MTITRSGALTAVLLLVSQITQARDSGPTAILGWWHGTSTCVQAPWNAACNDEEILYEFVPLPPDSNRSLLHAAKIVQGQVVPMGDMEFTYSPERTSWDGDFANARVNIRWTYELHGDTLLGQVLLRPDLRLARHVLAWRGKAAGF
jgi:hypothetical protein